MQSPSFSMTGVRCRPFAGVLLIAFTGAISGAKAQTASFQALGAMPGSLPGAGTYANSISVDGNVVVGYAWVTSTSVHAWRWTAAGGIQDLGDLGGGESDAYDVNFDGSVVVGYSYTADQNHWGFRWTAAGGMEQQPMYEVQDVSGDGNFFVGVNIWRTASGQTGMFNPNGNAHATGVSTIGQVVVGYFGVGLNTHAFRWTAAGGMQDLGVTTGTESDARGISGDGAVVVGEARDAAGFWRAFRWTAAQGMVDLGTLGGPMSNAFDASSDGSVIVGTSLINSMSSSERAFRWTASHGMENLKQLLLDAGVTAVQNWILFDANGVSGDGTVITGFGTPGGFAPAQPFIAVLPVPGGPTCYANCDGSTALPVLTVADFACFLNRFAAADPYANCDASTTAPVLNVGDFSCFLNRFAAGCS